MQITLTLDSNSKKDIQVLSLLSSTLSSTVGLEQPKTVEPTPNVEAPVITEKPLEPTPVVEPKTVEPTPEHEVDTTEVETKKRKKRASKETAAEVVPTEVETEITEEAKPQKPEVINVPQSKPIDGLTAEQVNEYAKSIVKPEYEPHYLALLKELGVTKFKLIPQDKLQYAWDKLTEIKENVVI